MQRKSNVKTLFSPLSAQFSRHRVMNGGTQRHFLPYHRSEEMKILINYNSFPRLGTELAFKVTLVPLRHGGVIKKLKKRVPNN